MRTCRLRTPGVVFLSVLLLTTSMKGAFTLSPQETFEGEGVSVWAFSNLYDGNFNDARMAGVEIVHHGVRTVTNGDVRLLPTPVQWSEVPRLNQRIVDTASGAVEAFLEYPDLGFYYSIRVSIEGDFLLLSVNVPDGVPEELAGNAGLNLEFLPAAYSRKAFMIDGTTGSFPLCPGGRMRADDSGAPKPLPLAQGQEIVVAPEDPERRIRIKARQGTLALYDGRSQAQNGRFVLRTLLPAGQKGTVLQWEIEPAQTQGRQRKQ